jgi:putative transcriptional regulator
MSEKAKFLKGQFLLDNGSLLHSWFSRTVVLLCEHNAEGAFGLVLNRATPIKISESVTSEDLPDGIKELPLFVGGPVQPSALSYLHTDLYLPDANVLPNLSLGHSLDELVEIGGGYSPTSKLKVFAGYAGWAPKQLEGEMQRDSWLTFPASLELIFDVAPDALWPTLLRKIGGANNLLLSTRPDDPSLN